MTSTVETIRFELTPTDPAKPLAFAVLLDGKQLWQSDAVTAPVPLEFEFLDQDGEHELEFVLSGKTQEHTVVDEQGNITQDSLIGIDKIQLCGVDISHVVSEQAVYTHDLNGSAHQQIDRLYQFMGCNGSVRFKFTSPVYEWLVMNVS